MGFQKGINPRSYIKNHRERGAKIFTYTYEDLEKITGCKKRTLQIYASRGELDMEDLESVIVFAYKRIMRRREQDFRERWRKMEFKRLASLIPLMTCLTKKQREVLFLRYTRGDSWDEIAKVYKISKKKAKAICESALKKIAELFLDRIRSTV